MALPANEGKLLTIEEAAARAGITRTLPLLLPGELYRQPRPVELHRRPSGCA